MILAPSQDDNSQGLPYQCGHKSEETPLLLAFALARICISNRRACIKYLPFRILCATKLWLPRLLLLAAEVPPVVPLVVNRRTRIFLVALLPVVLPLLLPLLLLMLLLLLLVVLPHTAPLSLLVRGTLPAVLRLSSPARCLV